MNKNTFTHNTSYERIFNRIHNHINTAPKHSLTRTLFIRYRAYVLAMIIMCFSLALTLVVGYQSHLIWVFSNYIGTSLEAFVWMYMGDILIVSAVLIILASIIVETSKLNRSLNRFVLRTSFMLVFGILVFTFGYTGNVKAIEPTVNSIQKSTYKAWTRDQYINNQLNPSQEYFGVVTQSSCISITIDHGGAVQTFEYNQEDIDCMIIPTASLVHITHIDGTIVTTDQLA